MITFEISDEKEVRRFRIAQLNGRPMTVKSGERTVTGHVRSVLERKSSVPQCWTITIIPSAPKSMPATPRSTPRFSSFVEEDFY